MLRAECVDGWKAVGVDRKGVEQALEVGLAIIIVAAILSPIRKCSARCSDILRESFPAITSTITSLAAEGCFLEGTVGQRDRKMTNPARLW